MHRERQRGIHSDIQCQLTRKGGVYMRMTVGIQFIHIHFENTRGIIHRAALQTSKRKHSGMKRFVTGKSLVFRTSGRLITNQVWIRAAKSRRTYCLMGINHDTMLRSFSHSIQIMIIKPLSVMMFSTGNYIPHITTLDRVISIFIHQLISRFHMPFVVTYRG